MYRERTGDTSGAINAEFDWLGSNCPTHFTVLTDYASARVSTEQLGVESCSWWTRYIGSEAIALLREDGLCVDGDTGQGSETGVGQPAGAISWSEAVNYAGSTQYVCGPYAGTGTSDDDVFIDLGVAYPDTDRFTIVLWDIGGVGGLPSVGTTMCTTGEIVLYEGMAQIHLRDPSGVEIYG